MDSGKMLCNHTEPGQGMDHILLLKVIVFFFASFFIVVHLKRVELPVKRLIERDGSIPCPPDDLKARKNIVQVFSSRLICNFPQPLKFKLNEKLKLHCDCFFIFGTSFVESQDPQQRK